MAQISVAELHAEACRFFADRVPSKPQPDDSGAGEVYTILPRQDHDEAHEVQVARDWQRALFDNGLAWVDGPAQYGGRGLTLDHARAVRAAASGFDVPPLGCLTVSLDIVRPAVLHAGTEEQKQRWLPAIVRADLLCCQLFSEPEAGSDLAGLRTTARADDVGTWTVNGQKVWSSGAHFSDLGLLLARTGAPGSRGRGLTLFLIDMHQAAIDVRPLRQMSGGAHFNEVFLGDATVEDRDRIGAAGTGWPIANATLSSERSAAGDTALSAVDRPTQRLLRLAQRDRRADEAHVREAIAESYLREQLLRRTIERFERDPDDLAGASVIKLVVGQNLRLHLDAAQRVLGRALIADDGRTGTYAWSHLLLSAPAHRIAGGTDEIQKNILAERVLGLPREPRPEGREQN